ncbi:GNAT family N-acetyltransferase [Bacillus chungangensis]|uniref:GNAT family N-acyltransferase n=1 Tax=Bacillus chungangensis TaxID=587633 RepID=A0ABT9WMV5_9BACI|nr:GNAT family N-acetyltransferase [Bacillus chungangensis]MDQ0174608.1 putative GNAT family N-acyltransferase [Bacillus chungangensis]
MNVTKVSTEQQLKDAFSIRKKVFIEEQHVPVEIEMDEYENESAHFVLYVNENPAGAGRFRIINNNGKIERVCILPRYRGLGAGNHIMKAIEDYAKTIEVSSIVLHAQTHAIPFYKKLGYQEDSEEFYDAGIPHKSMKKFLD